MAVCSYCMKHKAVRGSELCILCGGDPDVEVVTDEGAQAFIGVAKCDAYEEWFAPFRAALNAVNQLKWDALGYLKKCAVLSEAYDDGIISWGEVRGR